jgi:hypothetical protein
MDAQQQYDEHEEQQQQQQQQQQQAGARPAGAAAATLGQPPLPPLDQELDFEDWGGERTGYWQPTDGKLVTNPQQLAAVARVAVSKGVEPDRVPAVLCVPPDTPTYQSKFQRVRRLQPGQVPACQAAVPAHQAG